MEKLTLLRQEINQIDREICDLIEKRFAIVKKMGMIKLINQLPILSEKREQEIKNQLLSRPYGKQLINIYECLFSITKDLQKNDFFLVGKKLDYSLSPIIHQLLGNEKYALMEINQFEAIKNIPFQAINITNPYKTEAYYSCDDYAEEAKLTKTVNLIVAKENKKVGFNTDFQAFLNTLDYFHIKPSLLKTIIIGNGATARTIKFALMKYGCQEIVQLVRENRSANEYLLDEYHLFKNYHLIINATPYGTNFEDNLHPLFPLSDFHNLKFVMDVVYNPPLTPLLMEAKAMHVPCVNGLYMLISQAAIGLGIVNGNNYQSLVKPIFLKLKSSMKNIVFIGMPYSGKTTFGQILSAGFQRPFYDVDEELKKAGNDLPNVLKTSNIDDFRQKEAEMTLALNKKQAIVLATGGGIVLNAKVMQRLKQTSVIVFINTPLDELVNRIDGSRPLAKTKEQLEKLFINRISLYHHYADIVVNQENQLLEKINEYLNYQWA
ncbi:MAG: shikimate kinase [Bacilli bacterium]